MVPLRLVACQNCHTQYDVTDVSDSSFPCRCGETVENRDFEAVDAQVHRCGSCGAHLQDPDAPECSYCGSAIVRDDADLSLICPECHGRNSEASRFCTACGVAFDPEPVKIEGHELPCPACDGTMPPRAIGGVGINECSSCNGIWTPGDRLEVLLNRAIEAQRRGEQVSYAPRVKGGNPSMQQVAYRKCPECNAHMQRRNYRKASGVIIDRCGKHGVWLDADELEQITGFVLSGGRPEAERMMEAADREAAAAVKRMRLAEFEVESRSYSSHAGGSSFMGRTIVGVLKGLLD